MRLSVGKSLNHTMNAACILDYDLGLYVGGSVTFVEFALY